MLWAATPITGKIEGMDAVTLYVLTACTGFTPASPPCSASMYYYYAPNKNYVLRKDDCLSAARHAEGKDPKYKAYCVGNDGVSFNASGQVVDKEEYYKALARWHEEQDRKKLSAGARDAIPASPSTSATAR